MKDVTVYGKIVQRLNHNDAVQECCMSVTLITVGTIFISNEKKPIYKYFKTSYYSFELAAIVVILVS